MRNSISVSSDFVLGQNNHSIGLIDARSVDAVLPTRIASVRAMTGHFGLPLTTDERLVGADLEGKIQPGHYLVHNGFPEVTLPSYPGFSQSSFESRDGLQKVDTEDE